MKLYKAVLAGIILGTLVICAVPFGRAAAATRGQDMTHAGKMWDAGDFSGDSDYDYDYDWDSDSDWGSDSDWDWDDSDSDWDWDDDDDDYYYYGGPGNSGGGGQSSTGNKLIYGATWAVIIGATVIPMVRRRRKNPSTGEVQVVEKPKDLQPIESYKELDPGFEAAEFQARLSNLYVQLQNFWTAKDLSPMRPYMTDVVYEQFERQLSNYKKQHITNRVENISVLAVELLGFTQTGGEDHIVAKLRTRINDYVVKDGTEEVVKGDPKKEKFMTYEWTLSRTSGLVTETTKEMKTVNCPNCGAPLSINETAKCPYCGTVVTVPNTDFVISSIRGLKQKTV